MGQKERNIPEDENKLLVQTSQKVFMLHDLQYPAKINSCSTK